MSNDYLVVVTGGASCLGQHLIRQIHRRASHITHIRIFEQQPFIQELEYAPITSMEVVQGNILVYEDVAFALRGACTCFHLAVTEDRHMFFDMEPCEAVNVKGTDNVIRACCANGVSNLIFVTSVDVVIGYDDLYLVNEEESGYPKKHLFPDAITKQKAEEAVLKANEHCSVNTIVLRPVEMYGELDKKFIPKMLRFARYNMGELLCVGDINVETQIMYAGNVAWAILCAERQLMYVPEQCSGKAYFITDDTPPDNLFFLVKPMLRRYGFFVTDMFIPEKIAKNILVIMKVVLWLLYPFIFQNPIITYELVHYFCHTNTFSDDKARQDLLYRPIYSVQHAWKRTHMYFDKKFKLALVDFMTTNVVEKTGHTGKLMQLQNLKKNMVTEYAKNAHKFSVEQQTAGKRVAELFKMKRLNTEPDTTRKDLAHLTTAKALKPFDCP